MNIKYIYLFVYTNLFIHGYFNNSQDNLQIHTVFQSEKIVFIYFLFRKIGCVFIIKCLKNMNKIIFGRK